MTDASVGAAEAAGDPTEAADLPQRGRLVAGAHRYPIAVQFEDIDLSGMVHHANYLRYFDRARSDLLRLVGIDQRAVLAAGGGPIAPAAAGVPVVPAAGGGYVVASANLRYLRSARFDDALLVVTHIVGIRAAGVDVHQTLIRGGVMLADAAITAVLVGPAGRPRRQPRDWVAAFEAIGVPPGRPAGAPARHRARAHRGETSA